MKVDINTMDRDRFILFTGAFFIILCAFVAAMKPRTKAEFFTTLGEQMYDAKNYLYATNGMMYFFCAGNPQQRLENHMKNPDNMATLKNILAFDYRFNDTYCKEWSADENVDKFRCGNLFPDFLSCPDFELRNFVQFNVNYSTSLNLDPKVEGCRIRIFNNYYKFLKATTSLKVVEVIPMNTLQSVFTTSTVQGYRIKIEGNKSVLPLVLLRPFLVSLGSFGVYTIRHYTDTNTRDNMFDMYPNLPGEESNFYYMYLAPVNSNNLAYNLNPVKNPLRLEQLFKTGTAQEMESYPVTLYYLSFDKPYTLSASSSIPRNNTLSLVFSNEFLKNKASTSGIGNLEISLGDSSYELNPNIQNMVVNFNLNENATINDVFKITYNMQGASPVVVYPHETFRRRLLSYRSSANQVNHRYHILVITSVDMVIIAAFVQAQDGFQVNDNVFVTKFANSFTMGTLFHYNTSLAEAGIAEEMKKYSSFMTTSSIPNLAYAAKALGYKV